MVLLLALLLSTLCASPAALIPRKEPCKVIPSTLRPGSSRSTKGTSAFTSLHTSSDSSARTPPKTAMTLELIGHQAAWRLLASLITSHVPECQIFALVSANGAKCKILAPLLWRIRHFVCYLPEGHRNRNVDHATTADVTRNRDRRKAMLGRFKDAEPVATVETAETQTNRDRYHMHWQISDRVSFLHEAQLVWLHSACGHTSFPGTIEAHIGSAVRTVS